MEQLTLTLQEMAQLALGVPKLANVNVAMLNNLISILLRKLDWHEEKVTIGGFECRHLKQALDKARQYSPLPFEEEQLGTLGEKLKKVDQLEKRIGEIDAKLEQHFNDIRSCNTARDESFQARHWERFSKACEDLCTIYDPENEVACLLMRKPDFVRKLIGLVGTPMANRVVELEGKVNRLDEQLRNFIDAAEEQYAKLAVLEDCVVQIEDLRQQVGNNYMKFLETMAEIQDILDSKLEKAHVPVIKHYVKNQFESLEKSTLSLKSRIMCPRALGIVSQMNFSCNTCASCGNKITKRVNKPPNEPMRPRQYCGCGLPYQPMRRNLAKLADSINPDEVERRFEDRQPTRAMKSCKLADDYDYFIGIDGSTYRSN